MADNTTAAETTDATEPATLGALIPWPDDDTYANIPADEALDLFLGWASSRGIELWDHQEEALLDLAARGREQGFACALVHDAGLTEFHGEPTFTCLAFEPLRADQIDPLTGDLPLY